MHKFKIVRIKRGKVIECGREFFLKKKYNEKFLDCYMEVDRLCCKKFSMAAGGVTEYINRLNNVRYTDGRPDVLPKLLHYRGIRNKFAHEAGALKHSNEVSRADVKWLKAFKRELSARKDPISAYLRRERKYARRKRIKAAVFTASVGIIAALALALYFVLQNG